MTRKKAAQKEEDGAATKLQAIQRGKRARQNNKQKEDLEQAYAATKLQAMQRGKKARKKRQDKTEEDGAATKLQAMQRGKKARKDKLEKAEQDKAATLLQAKQRRHTAMKEVSIKEECSLTCWLLLRAYILLDSMYGNFARIPVLILFFLFCFGVTGTGHERSKGRRHQNPGD
jgi:hypothetical protein